VLLVAIVGGVFVSAQTAVPYWLAAGVAAAAYRAASDLAKAEPGPDAQPHK
jgi:hypothetical protein